MKMISTPCLYPCAFYLARVNKDKLSCTVSYDTIYVRLFVIESCVPTGSPSRGGDVMVYVFDINRPSLPIPFLFCSRVCFCLYGPFNCILFNQVSRQLSDISFSSSDLNSALLVLSTICLFIKVFLNPDIIHSG